jgi:hypothetical protein
MTAPKLNSEITIGNVVSWVMIGISLVVGYTKLTDASAQNMRDVAEAKSLSIGVQDKLLQSDRERQKEISEMKTDVAVIKTNILTINDKLDEIRINQRK